MQISQEVSPELSALSSFITLSEPLFERIRQIWEARESLQLDAETYASSSAATKASARAVPSSLPRRRSDCARSSVS